MSAHASASLGSPTATRERLAAAISSEVASMLGLGPRDAVDPDSSFARLGLDSLRIQELHARLEETLAPQTRFPPQLLLRYDSVSALAAELAGRLGAGADGSASSRCAAEPVESPFQGVLLVPALGFFGECGLADRWAAGERIDLESFAQQEGLDVRSLRALADYLAAYGYLDATPQGHAATRRGRGVIARWPGAMLFQSYLPLLADLQDLLRRRKVYGAGRDVYRDMHLDTRASGVIGVRSGLFQRVVEYLRESERRCVLDLGCGDGTFLAYACGQIPTLEGVGIDQSETALALARSTLAAGGCLERVTLRRDDLRTPAAWIDDDAVRRADAVTIFFIMHEVAAEGPGALRDLLRRLARAFPQTPIAITEEYRLAPLEQAPYLTFGYPEFLAFHELSKQNLLARAQWLAEYEQAGFSIDALMEPRHPDGNAPSLGTAVIVHPG